MNPSEDQLRIALASSPDDWSIRLPLAEVLASRGAGQGLDTLLAAAPNAPDSEEVMRRVVELGNTHCPGFRGIRHVLNHFLKTHLTSSWAHYIQAQAHLFSHDEEAALRHYQTSRSLNPARRDAELDALLASRNGTPAASRSPAESRPAIVPVPPKSSAPETPETGADEGTGVSESVEAPAEEAGKAENGTETPGEKAGTGNSEAAAKDAEEPKPSPPRSSENDHEKEQKEPAEADGPAGESKGKDKKKSKKKGRKSDSADSSNKLKKEKSDGKKESDPEKKDGENENSIARRLNTEVIDGDEFFKAAEREDDTSSKVSALGVAVLFHLVILIVFAFWQVVKARPDVPQFIASVDNNSEEEEKERPKVKRYQRPRAPSASTPVNMTTVQAVSNISMPRMDPTVSTFDPVGNDFGPSLSFGGGGGGSVSFFGSKSKSKRVIFVVDFSASMSGAKDELMRAELSRSIKALPPSVEYALIFFGGPAWYAGQKPGEAGSDGRWVANIVRDGSRAYTWYEGWSEKERHTGNRTTALYHYKDGERNLPKGQYRKASPSNIRQSLEHINTSDLIFGTDWRWPLMMAINMKPDNIFFMTDGAFGTGQGVTKEDMINSLLEYNRRIANARINTICMMVPIAKRELEQLAHGSRGEFTLVKSDGTTVRGSDVDN